MKCPGRRLCPKWATPEHVVKAIVRHFGCIALDPCGLAQSPASRAARSVIYESGPLAEYGAGLSCSWVQLAGGELAFGNVPYGRKIHRWCEKARREHMCGAEVLLLTPARVETKWWRAFFAPPLAGWASFLDARLNFVHACDGYAEPARWPSAFVYLGRRRSVFAHFAAELGGQVWAPIDLSELELERSAEPGALPQLPTVDRSRARRRARSAELSGRRSARTLQP